jgi:hypothetical protein
MILILVDLLLFGSVTIIIVWRHRQAVMVGRVPGGALPPVPLLGYSKRVPFGEFFFAVGRDSLFENFTPYHALFKRSPFLAEICKSGFLKRSTRASNWESPGVARAFDSKQKGGSNHDPIPS